MSLLDGLFHELCMLGLRDNFIYHVHLVSYQLGSYLSSKAILSFETLMTSNGTGGA